MQNGANIGHEWPQGLIPCRRPRIVEAWIATAKVIEVVDDSIGELL
jgi:hypothetical protein